MNIKEFIDNVLTGHSYMVRVNKKQNKKLQALLQANDIRWGCNDIKITNTNFPLIVIDAVNAGNGYYAFYSVAKEELFQELLETYELIDINKILPNDEWSKKQLGNAKKDLKSIFNNIHTGI